MRHEQSDIKNNTGVRNNDTRIKDRNNRDFVLEKSIFNNIFEKDIRRIFIYKKAERLAKAIQLIEPAFIESVSLRNRIGMIAIGLIDAAILPLGASRPALSRELLMLSSILSIARTGGFLSAMNAELIAREAHSLLQEVAAYEEPRLSFDESPTLSTLARDAISREAEPRHKEPMRSRRTALTQKDLVSNDGINKNGLLIKDRSQAVLSVIKSKGKVSIKDISTLIRGVSEKTIQRELLALIASGIVLKQGERRWSTYSLVPVN